MATAKDKKESKFGFDEWGKHKINCCSGCSNNCRYCGVAKRQIALGRFTKDDWKIMSIRKDDVNRAYRKRDGRVLFPTSHDITEDTDVKVACFTVLDTLLRAGNDVLITTKPRLSVIKEACNLFSAFNKQIEFRFTITSMNDELLNFWEPGASKFTEREESLHYAHEKGFKCSVSCEPFLDENPVPLIKRIYRYCDTVWIGGMNKIQQKDLTEEEKSYYKQIRKNYRKDNLVKIYMKLENMERMRFKNTYVEKLKKIGIKIS